jgi:hypothetical protein
MRALLVLFLPFALGGCTALLHYCDEKEARQMLRDLNPWDVVDVAAVGACAAAQAMSKEDERMYEAYQQVTFTKPFDGGIEPGAEGRLLDMDREAGHGVIRIYGKTTTVPLTHFRMGAANEAPPTLTKPGNLVLIDSKGVATVEDAPDHE